MLTERFYSELKPINRFSEITNIKNFVSVPDDWYIIVTDVVNSTKEVELGNYKDVNLLGAASIIAVLNIAQKIDIPFVFGGDGATVLIPALLYAQAKQALLALKQRAKANFAIDLRVGIVPVSAVSAANYSVKIAKLEVSENYHQAVLAGGGLTYATELIKDSIGENLYSLSPLKKAEDVNLNGLECRWQNIPSRHEEILSLIVLETSLSVKNSGKVYQEVLEEIEHIYGNEECYSPIANDNLRLTFNRRSLLKETKLRAKSASWLDKALYLLKIQLENLLGLLFMNFKFKIGPMDWGLYKNIVADATDYRKFDDMLRMVISGNAVQREQLINYLDLQYKAGILVYGTHVSHQALMTCLVFEYNGPQVHFIDGADGGYTLAAKAMKARLHRKMLNWKAYISLYKQRNVPPS